MHPFCLSVALSKMVQPIAEKLNKGIHFLASKLGDFFHPVARAEDGHAF